MFKPQFLSKIVSWRIEIKKWRKSIHRHLWGQRVCGESSSPPPASQVTRVSRGQDGSGQRFYVQTTPPLSSPRPDASKLNPPLPTPVTTSPEPPTDHASRLSTTNAVATSPSLRNPKPLSVQVLAPKATGDWQRLTPETPSIGSCPSSPIQLDCNANARREYSFWPTKPCFLGFISQPEGSPVCGGGYSDVWCCNIRFCTASEAFPTQVAVKVLRTVRPYNSSGTIPSDRTLQRFQHEGRTWFALLEHPNVAPLLGWTLTPNLSFISPWYKKGNIKSHLRKLSKTERLQLLLGIAKGLEYLHSHSPPVVHGDLKPENVLLSDQGEPLLTDFGMSIILGQEEMYSSSHLSGGSIPWMSPEQMMEGSKSCQSDVYSFGSLAFTVLTGKMPHAGLTNLQIPVKVCDSLNPRDPIDDWSKYHRLQGSVAKLLKDCWSRSPHARPSMATIVGWLIFILESRKS